MRADAVTFVGLGLFVLIFYVIDVAADPDLSDDRLLVLGVIMSLLPAILWLSAFYRRDALEPEPKALIAAVAVAGGLFGVAVATPVTRGVFEVDEWLYRSGWSHLLGAVLVVGFVHEASKYLGLRLFVHDSVEFDEVSDGIIYGTAVGIGFATVLNVAFVVDSSGAELGPVAFRIVVTTIAHASFGGVVGFFTAGQKLEGRPVWWSALGLTLAATLNGLFFYLRSAAGTGSGRFLGQPFGTWLGFLMAGILAVATAWILSRRLARRRSPGESAA